MIYKIQLFFCKVGKFKSEVVKIASTNLCGEIVKAIWGSAPWS